MTHGCTCIPCSICGNGAKNREEWLRERDLTFQQTYAILPPVAWAWPYWSAGRLLKLPTFFSNPLDNLASLR